MLHTWTANIRCDRYCSNFLEVGVELKGFALLVSGFRCEQRQQWKWLASERHRRSAGLRLLLVVVRWNIEHAAWRESRGEKSAVTLALRALLSLVLIVVSFKEKSRCSSSQLSVHPVGDETLNFIAF